MTSYELSARTTKRRLTWKKINSIGIGRTCINGCALSQDLGKLIGDEIVRNGGDINTGYFPGKFSDVASSTVKNIWQRLHMERTTEPRRRGGGKTIHLKVTCS